MGVKSKILSAISFICLAVVLTFVGVWAVTDLDFAVGGNITYTAPEPSIKFQQDENGFYVTMGSYNGEDVIWRLIGVDGEKFSGTSHPMTGTCTFILETSACSAITSIFHSQTSVTAYYYDTSTLRSFIKGDYLTQMGISTSDEIYQLITPRPLSEMPKDLYGNYFSSTEKDKLWCLSISQYYKMMRGGEATDTNSVSNAGTNPPEHLAWSMYWGFQKTSNGNINHYIYRDTMDNCCVTFPPTQSLPVRPAFNLVLE